MLFQTENTKPTEGGENTAGFSGWLYDWAEALVTALVVIVLLFSFVVRVSTVDGDSMLPTLHDGEFLLVSDLFYSPEPGDIIVAKTENFDYPIVKRVIATGGQLVDINFRTHEVRVDGVVLQETYINAPTKTPYDVTFPLVVPEGCVFVLGDNRNESSDSRDSRIGCIDERRILGQVVLRVLPISAFGNPRAGE